MVEEKKRQFMEKLAEELRQKVTVKYELEPDVAVKLYDLFARHDKDMDMKVDANEIGIMVRSLGLIPTNAQIEKLKQEVKKDAKGLMDFLAFVDAIASRLSGLGVNIEDEIISAFQVLDEHSFGFIPADYLYDVMTTFGEKLDAEEAQAMINAAKKFKCMQYAVVKPPKIKEEGPQKPGEESKKRRTVIVTTTKTITKMNEYGEEEEEEVEVEEEIEVEEEEEEEEEEEKEEEKEEEEEEEEEKEEEAEEEEEEEEPVPVITYGKFVRTLSKEPKKGRKKK